MAGLNAEKNAPFEKPLRLWSEVHRFRSLNLFVQKSQKNRGSDRTLSVLFLDKKWVVPTASVPEISQRHRNPVSFSWVHTFAVPSSLYTVRLPSEAQEEAQCSFFFISLTPKLKFAFFRGGPRDEFQLGLRWRGILRTSCGITEISIEVMHVSVKQVHPRLFVDVD